MARINFQSVVAEFLDALPSGRVISRNISGGYINILKQDFEKGQVSVDDLAGKIIEALGRSGNIGSLDYTDRKKLDDIIKKANR